MSPSDARWTFFLPPCDLAELVEVDSLRGGQHRVRVALRSRHDERLGHFGRREVECFRLGDGALGARVREELIAHSRLVEHARQVFRCHLEPRSLGMIAKLESGSSRAEEVSKE
jgi:hypothetical protein